MNTPRDLLLARHANARPKLDALRRRVVAGLVGVPRTEATAQPAFPVQFWRELFWSCRRAWLGLGSAWALIVFLHLTAGPATTSATDRSGRTLRTTEMRLVLAEHARLRAELLGPDLRPLGRGRTPLAPGPRSEAVAARGMG